LADFIRCFVTQDSFENEWRTRQDLNLQPHGPKPRALSS
jgi:hypothetical protein